MKTTKKTVKATPKKLAVCTAATKKAALDYEKDFSKWAHTQAKILKKKEFSKLDIDNLIEEIEDLSKREQQRLTSHLEILLIHKLKAKFQPEKQTNSWILSIKESSYKAQRTLSNNPSLQPKLKEILKDAYFSARLRAAAETELPEEKFPEESPWTLKDIFPELEKKYY